MSSQRPAITRPLRYLLPLGAVAATAVAFVLPQPASGSERPKLPPRTAAQLLASIEQAKVPSFTGTTVVTARLGLPSLPGGALAGASGAGQSQLQQAITLLTGSHTAHVAYDGPERQRIALFLGDLSETDVVHNGKDVWTYASQGNTVSHSTLPDAGHGGKPETSQLPTATADPTKAAERALAQIDPSTAVTVDRTAMVARRPAYQLVLNPRDARSLVGSVRIAIDAATAMPTRVQIWPRSGGANPAFEVGFTTLTLRAPSASTFSFTPPAGAIVGADPRAPLKGAPLKGAPLKGESLTPAAKPGQAKAPTVVGQNWTSVLVTALPQPTIPAPGGKPATPNGTNSPKGTNSPDGSTGAGLSQTLDKLATSVAGGHLIATSLVSILLTNDDRLLVGSVTPAYLEQVAVHGSGR